MRRVSAHAHDAPTGSLPPKCEQAATARISDLGLASVVRRGTSSEIRTATAPSGFRARFYDPNCGGYIVINLNGPCGIERIYTIGNCRIQGMAHWW
ncbi:hypothetical protein [Azospirillum doebereinerae]